jgi:ABC-2 type transport system permease protein
MSLWRLEWLRLVRSRRMLILFAVYVFFGLTGPLSARYLSQIVNRVGNGVKIELPPPTPADGLTQFTSNATQIGLLVVVLIAAAGLALDARTEMATFLRTRVPRVRAIVIPAYAMTALVSIGALLAGCLSAWYETTVLLGAPPLGRTLAGIGFMALGLAFAVAVTAVAAYLVRGVLATAGLALVFLLVLALVGNIHAIGRWLPTTLLSALSGLARGAPFSDYLPAAAVAVVGTVAGVWGAIALANRREL